MSSSSAEKTSKNITQPAAIVIAENRSGDASAFQFSDDRPEAIAQRKLQDLANESPQTRQTAQLQAMADKQAHR